MKRLADLAFAAGFAAVLCACQSTPPPPALPSSTEPPLPMAREGERWLKLESGDFMWTWIDTASIRRSASRVMFRYRVAFARSHEAEFAVWNAALDCQARTMGVDERAYYGRPPSPALDADPNKIEALKPITERSTGATLQQHLCN